MPFTASDVFGAVIPADTGDGSTFDALTVEATSRWVLADLAEDSTTYQTVVTLTNPQAIQPVGMSVVGLVYPVRAHPLLQN